ncbi:ArpU family transcriptional regulator [Cytobacillus spongiae]|uniref:ArpU family phage packaging/lysis transcriptional regulator n=1 Tax=Cytobacillus spongiae TaxID=2901381 RepID=UPI001F324A34|nr:ArpU family phage packaging/lysis transcriptional regulator [Cytobacillus spongiae]UII56700.1 ArpU family transcriptional regulator [Cytobacillus spongiae]
MSMQMSLFKEVDEKHVRSLVAKELKLYRALKIQSQNKEEQKVHGVINLFPSLRDRSEEATLKIKQIERALYELLDDTEKLIIELKYLSNNVFSDLYIMEEVGLKKDQFYRKKRSAINMIATALAII